MAGNNPQDLSGIWTYPQVQKLDDQLAIENGHTYDDGKTGAPHGTYTPIQYFWIHMGYKDGVDNAILDIFNNNGCFCRFVWNGKDAWVSQADSVQFRVPPDDEWTLFPTLVVLPEERIILDTGGINKREPDLAPQRIEYDTIDKTFTWYEDTVENGLVFEQVHIQERSVPGSGSETFGDTFKGQTQFSQVAFPFYGFNPLKMSGGDAAGGMFTNAGTPASSYKGNANQVFNGKLIFKFPAADSTDYVRGIDIQHAPFVPLGVRLLDLGTEEDKTHTAMLSTIDDRLRSWSVSLGLSAGVTGMFDLSMEGSYGSKIEEQTKNQSRYTVSRKVARSWVMFTDIPSMELDDGFLKAIQSITKKWVDGHKPPDWENFVARFGTHYAHAITQGHLEYAETRLSLQAESTACTKKVDLKAKASVVLEGAKGGLSGKFSKEWSDKHGIEVSAEDIDVFSIGREFPMGIFFDLRPITELMSPIFFPYNPADDWEQYAPWIWHGLRHKFSAYLNSLGLNQSVRDASFLEDYTPWKWKVENFSVKAGDPSYVVKEIHLAPAKGHVFLDSSVLDYPASRIGSLFFVTPGRRSSQEKLRFTITTKTEVPPDRQYVIVQGDEVSLALGSGSGNGCYSLRIGSTTIDISFIARPVEPLFSS
jgi:hypothetical protein